MKIISFVNMKGGVGKTTIALNVAHCLARKHHKKVAIIDIDPQFNATQCLFSGPEYVSMLRDKKDTIVNIFDNQVQPIASVVSGPSTFIPKELKDIELQVKHGINVLPGNIDLYRLEMISGEGREFRLQRFIEEAMKPRNFDYIIIDTPPTPSIWMSSALIASDYFLIPVKPDPLSIIGIDLLRSIIERKRENYGLKIKCLGVVFTMVERTDSKMFAEAKANLENNPFWKDYVFRSHIAKRSELAKEQLNQQFILTLADFDLRLQLQNLVQEILEKTSDA